ncbi:pancreatic alpha-amylase-like isoform X4 [Carassius auratus]|uniref:Alpha-amylase n=1 Tax=Carassius auratus TaxID=7957 RepID=A0A6P6LLE7_CARAU|nr:pancreatic alpha-amylase-like isoform X4 [Carassius auratus]
MNEAVGSAASSELSLLEASRLLPLVSLPVEITGNGSTMKLLIVAALVGLCLAQHNPNTKHNRTSIVHLFEWRWADIAEECERYLAPNGYGGVQISPPSESIVVSNPWHPWWQRYQPISYNLCSRSGTEEELKDMVTRCNNVGVNIYVDAVINHMCGASGGEGTHSSCGTYFNANKKDFPSVPYSSWDFNDDKCKTTNEEIENYNEIFQVRDCRLVSLLDLALEKDYVRGKVAEYLNKLIDLGVAGFRVDACKHMWPGDLSNIYSRLKTLNTTWFSPGTKPFIYQEVIDLGGESIKASEYFELGRVTEFKYSTKLGTVVRKWNKEKLSYLKTWGEGWAFMPSDRAVVFVDNHDNQRGHGAGGASVLTFWDSRLYKIATGLMLAHPYGVTRVMSSYLWDRHFVNGKMKAIHQFYAVRPRGPLGPRSSQMSEKKMTSFMERPWILSRQWQVTFCMCYNSVVVV